jgi:alpha-tubulin N-acetyltransferase 1
LTKWARPLQKYVTDLNESLQAQGLPSIITTVGKLCANEHTCYFKVTDKAVGFIKVGYKKLFVRTRVNSLVEMQPLCVLDFYVNERVQRGGYGR